ncbi:methyltransferase domain-containing protein [Streptomyces sp. NBC_00091]|uniref:methyltransferase domain-containing protein n=1 Tax=Streptomyces sp. NBC_00091 TaxID=2975648 RepID=UPI0022512BDF|nr:methyltransferase domain-containing protein [Streptomyces sp. NBC_00091]MCX5380578.1 methyltransferase domain-containing protein [Streptomyces sp. NBC_00091]
MGGRSRAAAVSAAVFAVADAQALPVRDGACDAAVSALALNFLPAPEAAVAEATRAVRPGGPVAAALPVRPDGSIALTARAWAVRGRRPAR